MFCRKFSKNRSRKFCNNCARIFFLVVRKRAREERERERKRARRMCKGHRSSATGDKLSTRAVTDEGTDGRTDGRMDGWMGDSTRPMTDGCFNAVTAVENQSFLPSFPFSTESLNGLLHRGPFSHCLPNQHVILLGSSYLGHFNTCLSNN